MKKKFSPRVPSTSLKTSKQFYAILLVLLLTIAILYADSDEVELFFQCSLNFYPAFSQ
jgi:hypothetical protein